MLLEESDNFGFPFVQGYHLSALAKTLQGY